MTALFGALFGTLARPLLFALDPEAAHRLTVQALRTLPILAGAPDDPRLAIGAFGLTFPNPLGMAAGFDKDAEVPDALLRLGFGFTEVGTVTPQPQQGNPRPRVFRLVGEAALVNRLGFNNEGHLAAHRRLARRQGGGIVGVNIGAGKDSLDRVADYVAGIGMFADVASYFAVNVSSPNTPGLRDLQRRDALDSLLARVLDAREAVSARYGRKPVLLKISPDVGEGDLDGIVAVARARRIDGMIVANTTVSRPVAVGRARRAAEHGGLSGRPLFGLSTRVLAQTFLRVERQFPLIGVGGIDGPRAAYAKIRAGASLLQLYTALAYEGPGLVAAIKRGLIGALAADGHARLADAVGADAADWASGRDCRGIGSRTTDPRRSR